MVIERIKAWFQKDLASTFLDDLLDELAGTDGLDRREVLWAEVLRRFNQDVERAAKIAGVADPAATAADIMDAALRWVGSEPSKHFSREVARLIDVKLGAAALNGVVRMLYLRQLVTEVPSGLIRYANAFLDSEMELDLTANRLNEDPAVVERRVREFWTALRKIVPREISEADLAARTNGVWTYLTLESE